MPTSGTHPVQDRREDDLARVHVARAGDAVRAGIDGELDMSNARTVSEQLQAAAAGSRTLTVDLARLAFIDSAGISALVRLVRGAGELGCAVVVDAPAGSLAARTLALTGMDQVLPMVGREGADSS